MYAVQVHVLNTAVAWLDMLLAEQRTFSKVHSVLLHNHVLAYSPCFLGQAIPSACLSSTTSQTLLQLLLCSSRQL